MSDRAMARADVWHRGVPVRRKTFTPETIMLLLVTAVGATLAIIRLFGGLGPFSGMTDSYAWGVWKTFNVMTLTALGSSAMGVGFAVWVLGYEKLHGVMRVSLVTSFLFYMTGLVALLVDVGRPWNMVWIVTPWNWNTESALFEVALAMPLYATVFLAFENLPLITERWYYLGSEKTRARVNWFTRVTRPIYPFMVAGAILLPMGHQSSLGALMLLAGPNVHPLYQTLMLPYLYVIQAAICGFAFVTFLLMASSATFRRPIDMKILSELASLASWTVLFWFTLRMVDLWWRDALGYAFAQDWFAFTFWLENLLVLGPAIAFRSARLRLSPRTVFVGSFAMALGGLMYRFVPTTIAFQPNEMAYYFPTIPEIVISVSLMCLALALYAVAVKWFAILPAPLSEWQRTMDDARLFYPHIPRDEHGNPLDD